MKFFDTDWNCIFHWLAVWNRLSVAARRHYLLAVPSHAATVAAEGYGGDLAFALQSGLVESVSTGRLRPTQASVPFRALMAQLAKFPLFDHKPTRQLLDEYVVKHYIREESDSIRSSWNKPFWNSLAWPRSFLDLADVRGWEERYLTWVEKQGRPASSWRWSPRPSQPPKVTWFPSPEIGEAAQCLVRRAVDSVQPVPILSLPDALPERLRPGLEPALKACLRFMLLYPALRQDSLEAVIGLCPAVVYLLNRPAPVPPAVEPCKDLIGVAFRLEDMTRVLAEAATGECRINRSSYGQRLFKVIEDKLREEFVTLPPWLEAHHEFGSRLATAIGCLTSLKLAEDKPSSTKRLLAATAKDRKWLAQPAANRLAGLLFEIRRRQPEKIHFSYDPLSYMPGQFSFGEMKKGDFDHHAWLGSVWRQTPDEGCVALNAFLDYHARVSHPLRNPAIPEARRPRFASAYDGSERALREEAIEEICREALEKFFWQRLVPLGCVQTTLREDGQIWFRLSPAGKYLFGQAAELAYGQPAADAAIVVQPNFDIVFLQPNLSAEVELSPLAEHVGNGVGTLFRLSRRRVILAASQGTTAEAALTLLQKYSSKPLPANVTEELRSWFAACRSLVMRRAVLIDAGDAETALRVRRLLGPDCRGLGSTLLEWPGTHVHPKLRAKLTEQGLFLEKSQGPAGSELLKTDDPTEDQM
jgi:hypothetical protein